MSKRNVTDATQAKGRTKTLNYYHSCKISEKRCTKTGTLVVKSQYKNWDFSSQNFCIYIYTRWQLLSFAQNKRKKVYKNWGFSNDYNHYKTCIYIYKSNDIIRAKQAICHIIQLVIHFPQIGHQSQGSLA